MIFNIFLSMSHYFLKFNFVWILYSYDSCKPNFKPQTQPKLSPTKVSAVGVRSTQLIQNSLQSTERIMPMSSEEKHLNPKPTNKLQSPPSKATYLLTHASQPAAISRDDLSLAWIISVKRARMCQWANMAGHFRVCVACHAIKSKQNALAPRHVATFFSPFDLPPSFFGHAFFVMALLLACLKLHKTQTHRNRNDGWWRRRCGHWEANGSQEENRYIDDMGRLVSS